MKRMPWWAAERWRHPPKGLDRIGVEMRARWLKQHLEDRRPDVVHFNVFLSRSRFDVSVARRAGATVVGHLRQLSHQGMPRGSAFDACDHFVAVSDHVADEARRRGCRRPITTVYNAVHLDDVTFGRGVAEARRRLGLPVEGRVLGFPAALEPRKGQDVALAAFFELARIFPDLHIAFAGARTTLRDGHNYVNKLISQATASDFSDRIHFLGTCRDMAAFYAASNIVLALSKDGEAFGRVAVEAALAERPLIATRAGATPEVVLDGESGILVEPASMIETKAAVNALLTNEQKRSSIVRRAREIAQQRFDSQTALDRCEAFFTQVAQKAHA